MDKDQENESKNSGQTAQNVVDFGSAMTRTAHGTVYTMAIIGQIEGHTAAPSGTKTTQYVHMLPLLAKLEESREVDGILFLLNTVGGDVEAGLAMAELIAGLTKPTAAIVLGGSHSIGVPLAVAAQRSFAVPSAAMTIHPVRISGTVIAAPQTFSYFQRLQERIVAFVAGHSHISAERFQALMLAKDDMAAALVSLALLRAPPTTGPTNPAPLTFPSNRLSTTLAAAAARSRMRPTMPPVNAWTGVPLETLKSPKSAPATTRAFTTLQSDTATVAAGLPLLGPE